jgi:hypothetical protein
MHSLMRVEGLGLRLPRSTVDSSLRGVPPSPQTEAAYLEILRS